MFHADQQPVPRARPAWQPDGAHEGRPPPASRGPRRATHQGAVERPRPERAGVAGRADHGSWERWGQATRTRDGWMGDHSAGVSQTMTDRELLLGSPFVLAQDGSDDRSKSSADPFGRYCDTYIETDIEIFLTAPVSMPNMYI